MYSYSILPLDTEHKEELCADIKNQYKKGIADLALFILPMAPEGIPTIDKASILGEEYAFFRDELAKEQLDCGILVQSSIGHGAPLNEASKFTKCVNLTDGKTVNVCCPYDDDFCEYMRSSMHTLAKLSPKIIMVDDDFRLISRPGRGCACKKHLQEFNKRAGTCFTREELLEALSKQEEDSRLFRKIFFDIQHDSLVKAAKAMREGIDSVDPYLQGAFCACGQDPAGEIAQILAGKGNPSILRVNNGNYTPHGARYITKSFARAAMQTSLQYNKADVYLAETDTCPQNRYSTSAASLHAHFTGSILEGMTGAKHWITRTMTYEPKSGSAYREILAQYSGFYRALFDIVKNISWLGCRIPMPASFEYQVKSEYVSFEWASDCLERLGLPLYFSPSHGGAVCINGEELENFTEEERLEFFKGTLLLASESAEKLQKMGYGHLLGVELKEWNGSNPSFETVFVNDKQCSVQNGIREMIPLSDEVEVLSYVCHLKGGTEVQKLFPGVTLYKNELGGTTIIFCGTPKTEFVYSKAFSFLNESRKLQLIDVLRRTNHLPVYYPADAEVYLRAGYEKDGTLFVSFFNIGLDHIEKIVLCTEKELQMAWYLTPDGKREPVSFSSSAEGYLFDISAPILKPVILFLKFNRIS